MILQGLCCDLYYMNAITLSLACFRHMITMIIVLLNTCKTDYIAHTLYKTVVVYSFSLIPMVELQSSF